MGASNTLKRTSSCCPVGGISISSVFGDSETSLGGGNDRILGFLKIFLKTLLLFVSLLSLIPVHATSSNERKSLDIMNDVGRDMGVPIVTNRVNSSSAAIGIYASDGISTLSRFISEAIKYVAILAMMAITWGGFTYITAYGEEKKVAKAKGIILYSLLAVLLSISAYAIIDLVNNLKIN